MKIYCLYNAVNNKRYIGQTSLDVSMRWTQHRKDAKREKYQHYPLYRAINKYGADSFELSEIGEATTQEEINNLEKLWIILLQSDRHLNGYNVREGGSNGKNSPETCAKISAAMKGRQSWWKGRKRTPENCANIGKTKIGNKYCVGRVLSAETKAKIGAKSIGREKSPETRRKMSETMKKIRAESFWSTR